MHACDCGTPIEWRFHETSRKRAPVELKPVPDGNVVLVGASKYRVLSRTESAEWTGKRHRLHFAACPNRFTRRDPVAHRQKEISSE